MTLELKKRKKFSDKWQEKNRKEIKIQVRITSNRKDRGTNLEIGAEC